MHQILNFLTQGCRPYHAKLDLQRILYPVTLGVETSPQVEPGSIRPVIFNQLGRDDILRGIHVLTDRESQVLVIISLGKEIHFAVDIPGQEREVGIHIIGHIGRDPGDFSPVGVLLVGGGEQVVFKVQIQRPGTDLLKLILYSISVGSDNGSHDSCPTYEPTY